MKKSCLYIVGTPIGNLGDMSPRAVEVLSNVDFIAAEDTRVTKKLLNHFGIKKTVISYREHNMRECGDLIVSRLANGENCAICTDAGMPAISDPGQELVALCHSHKLEVVAVPGPCALTTAIALSGVAGGRFTFEGFLSTNTNSRKIHLNELDSEKRIMVFYEAPHKLRKTLRDMKNALGDREIVLCREITKLYEEVIVTTFSKALDVYKEKEPKGEFVIVVSGFKGDEVRVEISPDDVKNELMLARENGMSAKDAVREVALKLGMKKNEVYKISVGEK